MIPVTIDHNRLCDLATVVNVASKYVNVTESNPSYEWWEKKLKVAQGVVDSLSKIHVKDAQQNGTCEKCDAEAFARAERNREHKKELEEFDAQLTGGNNEEAIRSTN